MKIQRKKDKSFKFTPESIRDELILDSIVKLLSQDFSFLEGEEMNNLINKRDNNE